MMNVEAIRRLVLDSYVMLARIMHGHCRVCAASRYLMVCYVRQSLDVQAITSFQGTALRAGIPGPYKLGPYQVFDRIADGRFGSVFRTVHEELDQWVCLKVFPKLLNDDFEGSIRLARELRVAVQLMICQWSKTPPQNAVPDRRISLNGWRRINRKTSRDAHQKRFLLVLFAEQSYNSSTRSSLPS